MTCLLKKNSTTYLQIDESETKEEQNEQGTKMDRMQMENKDSQSKNLIIKST